MSTTAKTILWIVIVVVVVGGGIWWWMAAHPSDQSAMNNMPGMTSSTTSSANNTTTTSPYPQGDSNQAIEQEMTSANTQINGYASDSASINQGMNDQPVQQAE